MNALCINVSPCFPFVADGEDTTVSIQIKLENEGSDEELETDMLYSPQLALKLALTEWLGEFCVPHQYNSKNTVIFMTIMFLAAQCRMYCERLWEKQGGLSSSVFPGRQVPQSGAKSTAHDVSSIAAPSLCSSTTVTTVFQQPIMSPAIPPLCLDPLTHPVVKRSPEVDEVSFLL